MLHERKIKIGKPLVELTEKNYLKLKTKQVILTSYREI